MDDASIIAGLKDGAEEAAAALVDRYGNRLLRAAFLLCGNKTEAQDHVQETLLRAVKSAARFRESSAIFPWLYGILFNVYRNHCRKQKPVSFSNEISTIPNGDKRADCALTGRTDLETLRQALDELSVEQREAIVLKYYEGLSIKEIADCAEASISAVKSRIFEGLRSLRKKYSKKNNFFDF